MSVRFKILGIAVVLLAVFAATTMLSTSGMYGVKGELGGIVAYHIPLSAKLSELDVLTFEYELNLHRLMQAPGSLPAMEARQKVIHDRIAAIFPESDVLLQRAMLDEANDVSDRLLLAEISGALAGMAKRGPEFLKLGDRILEEIRRGRTADARRDLEGFSAWYEVFGPDLAALRKKNSHLSEVSLQETEDQSTSIIRLNGILFVVAALVGLGVFGFFTYELYRAFECLIEGARKVESGELTVQLPVTSHDELGQLTEAFNRMAAELRSKEQIRDTFGKFVDPRIVATLLSGQAGGSTLAERRPVTIFFSDIKRFTAISELLTADTIVRLLNAYFTAMTRIVQERKGIVDKYIGDAVMAFWTTPFCAEEAHAAEACLAALAQQEALVEFRSHLSELTGLRRNTPDFRIRIGLATGDAVVGTIGSDTVRSFTVIGDTVNLASRLESANKIYGTAILASEDTIRKAQRAVEAREVDLVVVAGKTEPIRVFEVLSAGGKPDVAGGEARAAFKLGLTYYRTCAWDEAEKSFRQCLELCPEDGPSRAFLARLPALRNNPPGPTWSGAWDLTAGRPWQHPA